MVHRPLMVNESDKSKWPNEIIYIKEMPELKKKNAYLISVSSDFDIFDKFFAFSKILPVIAMTIFEGLENISNH